MSRKLVFLIGVVPKKLFVSKGQKMIRKIIQIIGGSQESAHDFYRASLMTSLLKELKEEVKQCDHKPIEKNKIGELISRIRSIDPGKVADATQMLADGKNFDCMIYAVKLDPLRHGKPCADRLMDSARGHLEFSRDADRAWKARRRLLLALRFYFSAGAMSGPLQKEIDAGLEATKWVESNKNKVVYIH